MPEKIYVTVAKSAQASLEVKKSVFIASAFHIESEEQARDLIAEVKSAQRGARHNVWAYLLGESAARMSDDGEPQGTGGVPVLDMIKKAGVTDTAVVVTRYFGGILLGAPGLVRAYSGAAKLALDAAGKVELVPYTVFTLSVGYSEYGRLSADLERLGAVCEHADFAENVELTLAVRQKDFDRFCLYIRELSCGKAECKVIGSRMGPV